MTTHFEAMIASFYRQVAELGNQIDTAGISQEEQDILIRKYNTLLTNLERLEKRVDEFRSEQINVNWEVLI